MNELILFRPRKEGVCRVAVVRTAEGVDQSAISTSFLHQAMEAILKAHHREILEQVKRLTQLHERYETRAPVLEVYRRAAQRIATETSDFVLESCLHLNGLPPEDKWSITSSSRSSSHHQPVVKCNLSKLTPNSVCMPASCRLPLTLPNGHGRSVATVGSTTTLSRPTTLRLPRMVIRNTVKDVCDGIFLDSLRSGNVDLFSSTERINVVGRFGRDPLRTNVILELSASSRKRVLSVGSVYVFDQLYEMEDYIRVLRCQHCLSFGHLAKDCLQLQRGSSPRCRQCAKRHTLGHCKALHEPPLCHNCSRDPNVRGRAQYHLGDSRDCPLFLKAFQRQLETIDYGQYDENPGDVSLPTAPYIED